MNARNLAIVIVVLLVSIFIYQFTNRQSASAGKTGAPLVAVTVPSLSALAAQGEQKYTHTCASCHGKDAAGQEEVAPPLVHRIYEPSHHGDIAFLMAAQNGVRAHHWQFGDMPPVEDVTQDDVAAIVTYVRELQRANGIQ